MTVGGNILGVTTKKILKKRLLNNGSKRWKTGNLLQNKNNMVELVEQKL